MTDMIEFKELETKLKAMLKTDFSSLTIGFNDRHAPKYCDAKKFAAEYDEYEAGDHWISDEDRAAALEANSVWYIKWYPNTQVSFYRKYASSLPKLLDYVFNKFPKE